MPYDPRRDEIIFIEQFRIGPLEQERNPWLIEIVAGLVEEGESYEDVARREAKEEANCAIEDLHFVASFYPSPGGFAELAHVFIGKVNLENVGGVFGEDHEGEDIRVSVVSVKDAIEMLENGKIRSAIPMIALFGFIKVKNELQSKWLG